jgi:hypothetical protein
MELRLEADPMDCGKLGPCPKIWGTDDRGEVLIQGSRAAPEHRAQMVVSDDEDVVAFPRQALLEWAVRQLAEQAR